MKELINKVYETKMSDGSFEKLVSDNFEKMINDACKNLFTWDGPIKKQMEEKIKNVMSGVIEKTDFSSYVVKLQAVINESLKNTALEDYKTITDEIKKIAGIKKVTYGQKIKISEILEKYTEFIEEELTENDFEHDEINTDDGTKNAYLECYVEVDDVEEERRGYFSSSRDKRVVKLGHEKEEDHEDTIIEFELVKCYDGSYGVHIDTNFRVSELRYLPSFIVYLLSLEQACAVIEIDTTNDTMSAGFEFEWNYS